MHTNAWTNPMTDDIMSTISNFIPYFLNLIPDYFPNIMPVAAIYGTITTYTNYSCPLKWIVRTRGRYIYYYTEIQQRINDTRDRVLANYTYWSNNFVQVGNSLDAGLADVKTILTTNNCSTGFITNYMDMLKLNLTLNIIYINTLQQYYQTVAYTVPATLAYAFPNELIKALTRTSIMNFGDLGKAVHHASIRFYLHLHDNIKTLLYPNTGGVLALL